MVSFLILIPFLVFLVSCPPAAETFTGTWGTINTILTDVDSVRFEWTLGEGMAGMMLVRSASTISWLPTDGDQYEAATTNSEGVTILNYGIREFYSDDDLLPDTYFYRIYGYTSDLVYFPGPVIKIILPLPTSPPTPEPTGTRWIDHHMIYYGQIDETVITEMHRYELVVVHPQNYAITRTQVERIQKGSDQVMGTSDDVLVIGYIAVGEDLRTGYLFPQGADTPDYTAMLADERFTRNGIGPRVDPRGPDTSSRPLYYNFGIGEKSPGGTGFASYYLDDIELTNTGVADGLPDFNRGWRCAFVNAGDPLWFQELDEMRTSIDGVIGMAEILTTTVGRGLGCDGLFLDAIDTCGPNYYTSAADYVQIEFEWTAPGYQDFIRRLKEKYPEKLVVQNRGLFFFTPNPTNTNQFSTRPFVDFVLFESYRLDSDRTHSFHENYYPQNKYVITPFLMVEANMPDGFQVLSLGYDEGTEDNKDIPYPSDDYASLRNGFGSAWSTLNEDIIDTQNYAGFRHYITNRNVDLINTFVLDNGDLTDVQPPVWVSTDISSMISSMPPRTGVGAIQSGVTGSVRVYWDVALDKFPPEYFIYYTIGDFSFDVNNDIIGAEKKLLEQDLAVAYLDSVDPYDDVYPYVAEISGLTSGQTYSFCIRATDTSPNRNEEKNKVVMTYVVP